ncbi:chemotaxis protein [Acetobacter malorum]|uniref:Protein-glutamate methylesterase/protein-glutamine glutaminase n=1 Tax=Acetobacter malorum TaxID=178901 RepID=A0A149VHB2_9PROT|nr:chemotaxis response regulator protein-glutamate methylesterase [Acetobacter malorum]KXV79581.1 chemotaxis protein [Acetobacter malorum]
MEQPAKVLIVDDSRTMRALIRRSLEKEPGLVVCAEAANPIEARDLIIRDQPDVITLDVEMPGMNGLQFLDKIMRLRPIPVVMVSSLTSKGAETAIAALQMGAFDCFSKPACSFGSDAFAGLAPLVKQAAIFRPMRLQVEPKAITQHHPTAWGNDFAVVAIGASTGGVEALETVLSGFPAGGPPIVICQHMPKLFTASFAKRLDHTLTALSVAESENGERLTPGMVRIAAGGELHTVVEHYADGLRARLVKAPPVNGHSPSVDVLFDSVATQVGRNALGILLTGMGQDGAKGLLAMRQAGAITLAQDHASSVVYGMPRVAAEIGAACQIVPLNQMSRTALSAHAK